MSEWFHLHVLFEVALFNPRDSMEIMIEIAIHWRGGDRIVCARTHPIACHPESPIAFAFLGEPDVPLHCVACSKQADLTKQIVDERDIDYANEIAGNCEEYKLPLSIGFNRPAARQSGFSKPDFDQFIVNSM